MVSPILQIIGYMKIFSVNFVPTLWFKHFLAVFRHAPMFNQSESSHSSNARIMLKIFLKDRVGNVFFLGCTPNFDFIRSKIAPGSNSHSYTHVWQNIQDITEVINR